MSILLLIVWNQLFKYCIQIWLHHGITSILINIPLSIVGNPYLDKKYDVYFVNHLIQVGIIMFWNVVVFQRIVFGDLGHLGHLVQKLVGVEPKLDHGPRLRLSKMVEIVQVPEVTAKLAAHNLVQVSKIQHLLIFKCSFWY